MADESFSGDSTPRGIQNTNTTLEHPGEDGKKEGKGRKRSIFGFGKKKSTTTAATTTTTTTATTQNPPAPSRQSTNSAASPTRPSQHDHFAIPPTSPSRGFTSSPRLSSPATSQIFERDVQDSAFVPRPASSAIPNHIQTENYIPPVLDDASEAITNHRLDPDAVEIVTHASHQPASVTVTGAGPGTGIVGTSPYDQTSNEWARELASFADRVGQPADSASNYGSLDSSDVRRLSFISFADVVQSEHNTSHHHHHHQLAHARSRDNLHMAAGLTSLSPSALNRSPSPIRSPVSSQGGPGTSPPTSNPGSIRGTEPSPARKPLGSPTGAHIALAPVDVNNLTIETMTQALKRTGSTDLSRYRSIPQSPVEGSASH